MPVDSRVCETSRLFVLELLVGRFGRVVVISYSPISMRACSVNVKEYLSMKTVMQCRMYKI